MFDIIVGLISWIPLEKGELGTHRYTAGLDGHFSRVMALIGSDPFEREFHRVDITENERIELTLRQEEVQLLIERLVAQFHSAALKDQKNDTKAIQYRAGESKLFQKEPLSCLSAALRYASSEIELARCYAARSVAFFCLEAYESSLLDVQAALKLSTQKPDFSLLIRKCECLLHLGQGEEAKLAFDEARVAINSQKVDTDVAYKLAMLAEEIQKIPAKKSNKVTKSEPKLNNLFSVAKHLVESGRYEPQDSNLFLSKKVEIRFTKEHGRHLVATEDLAFGDIVGVTQPYAAVLTTEEELRFCHHCLAQLNIQLDLKYFPRSVPCSGCTRVVYCSEQCREESWAVYHRFECSLLLPLSYETTDDGFHLALRTLITAGGVERVQEKIQKLTKDGKEAEAMESVEFTDIPIDYYENIYRMSFQTRTYPSKGMRKQTRDSFEDDNEFSDFSETEDSYDFDDCIEFSDQIGRIIICAFMTKITKLDPNFATNLEFSQKEYSIVGILLRHIEQVRHNKAIFLRDNRHMLKDRKGIAAFFGTLDPLIGLVAPSCEPNLTITTLTSGSGTNSSSNISVLFPLMPIRAGTILTSSGSCYGDSNSVRFYNHKPKDCSFLGFSMHNCYCTYCKDNRPVTTNHNMDDIAVYMFTKEVRCIGNGCGGVIRSKDLKEETRMTHLEFQAIDHDQKRRLIPPEDESKSQCLTCEREFSPDEALKLKTEYTDIFKLHFDAYLQDKAINRIYAIQKNIPHSSKQRQGDPPQQRVDTTKGLTYSELEKLNQVLSMLEQLEAMITKQLAPLVTHGHCPLLLVEHYKQLAKQYSNVWVESQQIDHLRTGWKYAEEAHQTMVLAFGGDSAKLMLLMQDTISIFERPIELLKNSMTQLDNQMESMVIRNIKIELINRYYKAKGKLVKLEQKYYI